MTIIWLFQLIDAGSRVMTEFVFAGIGILAVFAVVSSIRGKKLTKAMDEAIQTKSLAPLSRLADMLDEEKRPVFYQQAITRLWEDYHRDLSIGLVREYVEKHTSDTMAQFWLRQALEVETASARKQMDDNFIATYFVPEVAKDCCKTSS